MLMMLVSGMHACRGQKVEARALRAFSAWMQRGRTVLRGCWNLEPDVRVSSAGSILRTAAMRCWLLLVSSRCVW